MGVQATLYMCMVLSQNAVLFEGGGYTTMLLGENEEISYLWSSVLACLHGSENARLTREVCVTIIESTWN